MKVKKIALRVLLVILGLVVVLALAFTVFFVSSVKKANPEAKIGDILIVMVQPATWSGNDAEASDLEKYMQAEAERETASNDKLPQFAGEWVDEAGKKWTAEYDATADWVSFVLVDTDPAVIDVPAIYYVQLKKDGSYGLLGPDSIKIDAEPVWLDATISNREITAKEIGTLKQL